MKKLYGLIGLGCIALTSQAQSVSYSHDASKMNQVTVMEIGSGTLTPDYYYWLLHNSYKKTANEKNKLGYRTLSGLNAYNQVEMAESLDSAMVKRAKVEALNIADRQGGALDIAWKVEGEKLTNKLEDYKKNIDRILGAGGSPDNQERWKDDYNMYKCAIKATQDAYMPNETLVKYVVRLYNATQTTELLSGTYNKPNRVGSIAASALNRWREAGWNTSVNGNRE